MIAMQLSWLEGDYQSLGGLTTQVSTHNGDQDVDARRQRLLVPTKPLDNERRLFRNDPARSASLISVDECDAQGSTFALIPGRCCTRAAHLMPMCRGGVFGCSIALTASPLPLPPPANPSR